MDKTPSPDFHGLLWEPTDEQEVVALFGLLLSFNPPGVPVCLDRARTTFPDLIALNTQTKQRINIEFEFRSASFREHLKEWQELKKARPADDWRIVCWHDDLGDDEKKRVPRVLSLRGLAKKHKLVLNWYPGDADSSVEQLFKWRTESLPPPYPKIVSRLQEFASKEPGFKIEWPAKNEPQFIVRHNVPASDASAYQPKAHWACRSPNGPHCRPVFGLK
jgi:hypothetical protein